MDIETDIEEFEKAIEKVRRSVYSTIPELNKALDKLRYRAYVLRAKQRQERNV